MSSPLAIGAVSAVLRNLLDNGLVDAGPAVGSVKVTAVAPDTVKLDDPNLGPSLNIFLYRVSPNQGWRNAALPSYDDQGSRRTNPPLGLDLHYLVTAYAASDFQAEILLGYAMSLLHERPVLDRAAIRTALSPSPLGPPILPPAFQALSASDLADQLEAVTVTLAPMDSEELSRLWAAMQAHYRPSAGYVVSVVLIESTKPARAPLPVLTRSLGVEPDLLPPLPTILRAEPPDHQPSIRLGETLGLHGAHLDGTALDVAFDHTLLDAPHVITVATNDDPELLDVTLPSGPGADADWPAGLWSVSVSLLPSGETVRRTTNIAAMILAPEVLLPPTSITRAGDGTVSVRLAMHPAVRPSQRATLALGTHVASAEAHPATTGTLDFEFGVVPDGAQWVRLSVDGAESRLLDLGEATPEFDPTQRVVVPG